MGLRYSYFVYRAWTSSSPWPKLASGGFRTAAAARTRPGMIRRGTGDAARSMRILGARGGPGRSADAPSADRPLRCAIGGGSRQPLDPIHLPEDALHQPGAGPVDGGRMDTERLGDLGDRAFADPRQPECGPFFSGELEADPSGRLA